MAPAPKTSSEPQASASDDVVCRSVADAEAKRAPLITLEGGRTIAYVRCECSKCQGLVMCGDKQLLPTAVTPSQRHFPRRESAQTCTLRSTTLTAPVAHRFPPR